jgi:SAM-dependent methyltransferase
MFSTRGTCARRLLCGPLPEADDRCPVCGQQGPRESLFEAEDRLHGLAGAFGVERCGSCASGLTTPAESPERIASFYPAGYGPYELPRNRLLRLISRAIRAWQGRQALTGHPLRPARHMPSGRAIDVGCGRGDLAALLVERGWAVTGIEPSPDACEVARARGVDARQGTLDDVRLEPAAYDLAVFQHSLEHVPAPVADLRHAAAALRPGGIVSITVPNFGSWQSRRFGSRWFHLDVPRHRVHFTETGLRHALAAAGLELVRVETSTSSIGLPASLQYAAVGRCLFPEGLRLRVVAGLCALTWPLSRLADRIAGSGDQLHAVARRPV